MEGLYQMRLWREGKFVRLGRNSAVARAAAPRLLALCALFASVSPSASAAPKGQLYNLYLNQGVRVSSYLASRSKVGPGVYRVRTVSLGPRSVYPSGQQTEVYTVGCQDGSRYVASSDERTNIDLRSTPSHAESQRYNLWWAVCRGEMRKY